MNQKIDDTQPDLNNDIATLCMVTIDAWRGSKSAREWLESNIKQFSQEQITNNKMLRYFKFLLELCNAEDKERFLLAAEPEMMEILRGLMPDENIKENRMDNYKMKINNTEIHTFDQIQRLVTLAALQGGKEAETLIQGLIERTPRETQKTTKGEKKLKYLTFLLELCRTADKEELLGRADQEIINMIEKYLPRDDQGTSITGLLNQLTRDVLQNKPDTARHIREISDNLSCEIKNSEEGRSLVMYLEFLTGLVKAQNKDAYLQKADETMVILMQQIMSE